MTVISTHDQAKALRHRARTGMAIAATKDLYGRFRFWQGYADCAEAMMQGLGKDAASKDRDLANEPQTSAQAAGAALPERTKDLTIAQVRQILAAQRVEMPTDAVADSHIGAELMQVAA